MNLFKKLGTFLGVPASVIGISLAYDQFFLNASQDAKFGFSILACFAIFFYYMQLFKNTGFPEKQGMLRPYNICTYATIIAVNTLWAQ